MSTHLDDLNERWFQAWLDKDATTVERLMAEDYVYIAPSGRVLDRQAILAIIRAPSYRLDRFARTEIVVRAVGNEAAVLRDRRQSAGSFEGASFTEDHRASWSGRKTRANGDSCWSSAPSATSSRESIGALLNGPRRRASQQR